MSSGLLFLGVWFNAACPVVMASVYMFHRVLQPRFFLRSRWCQNIDKHITEWLCHLRIFRILRFFTLEPVTIQSVSFWNEPLLRGYGDWIRGFSVWLGFYGFRFPVYDDQKHYGLLNQCDEFQFRLGRSETGMTGLMCPILNSDDGGWCVCIVQMSLTGALMNYRN